MYYISIKYIPTGSIGIGTARARQRRTTKFNKQTNKQTSQRQSETQLSNRLD